jgi:hypothetical protein
MSLPTLLSFEIGVLGLYPIRCLMSCSSSCRMKMIQAKICKTMHTRALVFGIGLAAFGGTREQLRSPPRVYSQ